MGPTTLAIQERGHHNTLVCNIYNHILYVYIYIIYIHTYNVVIYRCIHVYTDRLEEIRLD